jgi:two-component system chemotaxis response regulator CheY
MINIIIADDSALARTVIRRCLEITGYQNAEFFEAANGREALDIAHNKHIDFIVSDLNMPEMDGKTLLKHIKSSPKLTTIPVIIISSASNQSRIDELKKLGATEVLNKPISPAVIARVTQSFTKEDE